MLVDLGGETLGALNDGLDILAMSGASRTRGTDTAASAA